MRRIISILAASSLLILATALTLANAASADMVGPITFEPPEYVVGNINGQQGWSKTGPYDVEVAAISGFPDAAGYGFGTQSLRLSDAVTSGSFGDQTFSPGLASPAGETGAPHFDASFKIGTTKKTQQIGSHVSISPDDGQGSRMSYLRFEDQADGVHVIFADVTDPGPFPTVATFNETDIATLSRKSAHSVRFSIDFKPGPHNDVVKIYIDGALKITGTTWEDYYRYDPEQIGNGNKVPNVSKMLFRESGLPDLANKGQGFLVDRLALASTTQAKCPPGDSDDNNGGGDNDQNDASSGAQSSFVFSAVTIALLQSVQSDECDNDQNDTNGDGDGRGSDGD
jgi:hypothetical protein